MKEDRDQDLEQLKLLSIFHYVLGAMGCVSACFPIIHFGLGIAMLSGGIDAAKSAEDEAAMRIVGTMFVIIGGVVIVAGWAIGLSLIYAGRCLATHRNYTFCFVVACISCLFMPLGTLLGVFTIVVLMRDSVKELFYQSALTGDHNPYADFK